MTDKAALKTAREALDKAEAVLQFADKFFLHQDALDAAIELLDEVEQSPLHAEIVSALEAIGHFKSTHPE